MKLKSLAMTTSALVMSLGLTLCMTACDSKSVAATVGKAKIYEEDITTYVENFRLNSDCTDDAAWAQWLYQNNLTPEQLREEVIKMHAQDELIKLECESRGIVADPAVIDSYVEQMRSYFSSEEEWKQALQSSGYTEEKYREEIAFSLMSQELQAQIGADVEVADEDVLSLAQMYAPFYDGARKSSHILFAAEDEATALEVLDKINNGELDFAEAASSYSTDTASAADGGNVGWDATTTFVPEYQNALDALEKGEISGLVESEFGIHIILCTDVFNAPEEVNSLDQLPSEFVEQFRSYVAQGKAQTAFQEWLTSFEEEVGITINPMPEDLSYNVDISAYGFTEQEEPTTEAVG